MRNKLDKLVGRKVQPRMPRTIKEARAQLDAVRCGLEAAAVQLMQVGLRVSADSLKRLSSQIPALKKLVRLP